MFSLGFSKIAVFTQHNDGAEFRQADTEPMAYAPGAAALVSQEKKTSDKLYKQDAKKALSLLIAKGGDMSEIAVK
jgi:hypothetical protein